MFFHYTSRWILGFLFLVSIWEGGQLMAQNSGAPAADDAWRNAPPTSTGILVGQKIPAFNVPDQNGKPQSFDTIKGPNGAAIYFMRSADW
jgi:hypothetical protein